MLKPLLKAACLLFTPLWAHATAVTVDVGSFIATYDTATFSAGRAISSASGSGIDGYSLAASQFKVSTGADSLRIDFVELPPGSNSYYQGADTLLFVSGSIMTINQLTFNLPMTLRAALPALTAYEVTIGTHLSGSAYTQWQSSTSDAEGQVTILGTGAIPATQIAVNESVGPSGLTPAVATQYSGLFGTNDDLSAISGSFKVAGAYSKPCCSAGIRLDIDYVEIKAISTVPEPGTFALMGLGLAGLSVSRRRLAERTTRA
jgi:hypothetical protein